VLGRRIIQQESTRRPSGRAGPCATSARFEAGLIPQAMDQTPSTNPSGCRKRQGVTPSWTRAARCYECTNARERAVRLSDRIAPYLVSITTPNASTELTTSAMPSHATADHLAERMSWFPMICASRLSRTSNTSCGASKMAFTSCVK
jgi:hypothetical protein